MLLSAGLAPRARAGPGARVSDLRHVCLSGVHGQLSDLHLLHGCLDQDLADPNAAVRGGKPRSHHRRHLHLPDPAGGAGALYRRSPGRSQSPCGLLKHAMTQNSRGYGDQRPRVRWPGNARLAVSIVVNVEEGAELSLSRGDERNEHIYEAVEKVDGLPDLCMESHFAYGTRAGWPRIRALLRRYGVRATLNACGRAIAYSPWIGADGR